MKILLIFLLFVTVSLKAQSEPIYLNPDDQPVSEKEFLEIFKTQKVLVVKNDSLEIYKAVSNRQQKGKIDNIREIYDKVRSVNTRVDYYKPLIVIFYPGKDQCSTSGSATVESTKLWYDELERGLYKMAAVKPVYLYRRNEGMERYGAMEFKKDPGNIIERTFFKFHYPRSSFVVMMPTGEYIAGFGEFGKEGVWKSLKELMKKQ